MNVPKPTYEIIYNGKNITEDILPFVVSFTYTDKAKGEADEIELTLEDSEKLWQNEWYPVKGDKVSAKIFYMGGILNCGTFNIDELSGSGSTDGDTFVIKGIAAGITKKIRSKTSYAHEQKTIREIANTIASKHGLKVQGKIEDVRIDRVTQYHETDLSFLQRLADEYGYTFSIRDTTLTFTNIYEIEDKKAALTINRNEIVSYSISDKTSKTYKSAKVSHHHPKKKTVYTFEANETSAAHDGVKVDQLHIKVKAENKQQAELKARAALYKANSLQQEGNIEMPGNIYAIAGNGCEVLGIGKFSGRYYIHGSSHTVDKDGGYSTSLEIKRIGLTLKSKEKTK